MTILQAYEHKCADNSAAADKKTKKDQSGDAVKRKAIGPTVPEKRARAIGPALPPSAVPNKVPGPVAAPESLKKEAKDHTRGPSRRDDAEPTE